MQTARAILMAVEQPCDIGPAGPTIVARGERSEPLERESSSFVSARRADERSDIWGTHSRGLIAARSAPLATIIRRTGEARRTVRIFCEVYPGA